MKVTTPLSSRKLEWTLPYKVGNGINTIANFVKHCPIEIFTQKLYCNILAAMVTKRMIHINGWNGWQYWWVSKTLIWMFLLIAMNEFECSPRPPERQTREMCRTMRDTKPLFPSSPTDPLLDAGMAPIKDPRDPNTMLFHSLAFSFTTFSPECSNQCYGDEILNQEAWSM